MIYYFYIRFYYYVKSCLFLIFLLGTQFSFGQKEFDVNTIQIDKDLFHTKIVIDSISGYKQFINILKFPNSTLDNLELNSVIVSDKFNKTSSTARKYNAIAAVNGGFFNMKIGGLVTYFEKNDSTIYRTVADSIQRSKPSYFLNGAIVIDKNKNLRLDIAKSDSFYEKSKEEYLVMLTGPVLLKNGKALALADIPFVTNRHPRTCIAISEKEIFLITVDGRRSSALGMNLLELQDYLIELGCKDAINLDGGGSTTMWIKDKGVVNIPSDKNGERAVSNILMITSMTSADVN